MESSLSGPFAVVSDGFSVFVKVLGFVISLYVDAHGHVDWGDRGRFCAIQYKLWRNNTLAVVGKH